MEVSPAPCVRIRPFRADEHAGVWERHRTANGRLGPAVRRQAFLRRLARSGSLIRGRLDLAVEADGRLVGGVSARQPRLGLPPGVFELGIELFEPEDRGRGCGRAAVSLITSRLFDVEAAERVQASTAVWNEPMRAVLRRLGFVEEGVMRGFMPTTDGRDDYVLYAVTRADWS